MTRFNFFPLSTTSCGMCIDTMDTPIRRNDTDAVAYGQCGSCVQFVFLPLFVVVDFVTLPVRGIVFCVKK
jgi:hypothetical protein